MTTDQIISIIGHTATWLTVVLVFFTLREMSQQRKQSYKPLIIPVTRLIYGYSEECGSITLPSIWSEVSPENFNISDRREERPYLTIVNLGVGPAKKVKLRWNIDMHKLVNQIKDFCNKRSIPISIDLNTQAIVINIYKSYDSTTFLDNDLKSSHDYLLPVSLSETGIKVPIPFAIHQITAIILLIISIAKKEPNAFDILDKLIFDLNISCEDMAGEKHKTTYKGKISFYSIQTTYKHGKEAFSGQIEFSELLK